jgi:type III pantothenate kinase
LLFSFYFSTMIVLCFDAGNTRVKCGVFEDGQFLEEKFLPGLALTDMRNFIDSYAAPGGILSSVIDVPADTLAFLQSKKMVVMGSGTKLPISLQVDKPETVGMDRIAICAGAAALYPGQNNLVIGLGTCITYNFLNNQAAFLGGAISPGIRLRFKSMNDYTAKLPLVEPDWVFSLVGSNTKQNLVSGVMLGILYEIQGYIADYHARYGQFNAILTGGDLAYFAPHLKNLIFAHPEIAYKGLYEIWGANQ